MVDIRDSRLSNTNENKCRGYFAGDTLPIEPNRGDAGADVAVSKDATRQYEKETDPENPRQATMPSPPIGAERRARDRVQPPASRRNVGR
jgi:hypothetical protein